MRTIHHLALPLIITCSVLWLSGCTIPLLYPPSWDPNPVLTLTVPEHIKTLAACPRDETHVVNGINLHGNFQQPDNIKEKFDLKRGNTEYHFALYFDEASASQAYLRNKPTGEEGGHAPIFKQQTGNGITGRVRYIEQQRSCPAGGYGPMGLYDSRASFLIHNAYVKITSTDRTLQPANLNMAIRDLAQMLRKALPKTNSKRDVSQ